MRRASGYLDVPQISKNGHPCLFQGFALGEVACTSFTTAPWKGWAQMSSSSESSAESSSRSSSSSESRSSSSTEDSPISTPPAALPPLTQTERADSSSSNEDEPLDYGKIATVEEDAAVSGVPFFKPADTSSESDSESAGANAAVEVEQIHDALPPTESRAKSKKDMRRSGKRPKSKVRTFFHTCSAFGMLSSALPHKMSHLLHSEVRRAAVVQRRRALWAIFNFRRRHSVLHLYSLARSI